jgi:hypothetical protein
MLHSDQEAYSYCVNHHNTFIAIVWPIAQDKDTFIDTIMNRYGKILYKKSYHFTPKTAYTILKKAHANAHIPNMKEHLAWYFPTGTYKLPARIFVVQFSDTEHNLACKYAVRKLFSSLQYRSIHMNDVHDETIQLAKFFFR